MSLATLHYTKQINMKSVRFIAVLAFIICFLTSASQSKTELKWLKKNTAELKTDEGYNFSALKKAIGNRRIVALGESTHGSGTYYHLKSELVKFLHEEMGFEVLAMESGLGDTYLAYANIDTLSGKQLRDFSVFGNFRANEANGIFEYIKTQHPTKSPLNYVGYDTQASSDFLFNQLKKILADYDKELSDSLSTRMFSYQRAYGFGSNQDSVNYIKHRNIFIETSNTTRRYLEENKEAIMAKHKLSNTTYKVMVRSLAMFSASYSLSYTDRWKGYALRDSLMAENLKWLLSEVYANKKVIIWAHNSHVEKGEMENGYMKSMGHFLMEQHLNNYYTIGLFAYSGVAYQFWTKKTIPINQIDNTFIEHRLIATGKHTPFLDLSHTRKTPDNSWIFNLIHGYEVENGGIINFIPTKRFDAIIVCKESKAPAYNE
jgi:erythromycin esterase